MPKKPASAFCCFLSDQYAQHAGEDGVTVCWKYVQEILT